MNPISADFAALLTTTLAHFAWQGAVLALGLVALVRLLGVKSARTRYLLSVGTLALMATAPIATAAWYSRGLSPRVEDHALGAPPTAPTAGDSPEVVDVGPTGRPVEVPRGGEFAARHFGLDGYVLIAWLAGVSALSTRLAVGFGVTFWIRAGMMPLPEEFERRVRRLGEELAVRASRRVFASARVGQALAVGFLRPVVLVPASWLTEISPDYFEAIIAHELAHIRRWDLWVNLAQRVVETLLFYHPAVWWLSGRIRLEREMCCDEVAAGCFDRALYARSLESASRIGRGDLLMTTSIKGGEDMRLLSRIRYLFGLPPAESAGQGWAVGLAALVLPIAAAVAFSMSTAARPAAAEPVQDPAPAKDPAPRKDPVKVAVAHPQTKTVTVTERYVAQIHSGRHIEVRSLQTGYIQETPIREGQAVKKGDVLVVVAPVLLKAKLEAAKAERDVAQLEFNNTKKLVEQKSVSDREAKLFEAKLAKTQALVDLAQAEVNYATVRAPFDGIIGRLMQQQGSLVREGDNITTLSDNKVVWVYFNVSESRYLDFMAEKDRGGKFPDIELTLANGQKFKHVGKLGAIEATFNNQSGTIAFRADFPNPDGLLRHGQTGTVGIARELKDALVIPQKATLEQLDKRYVYVLDEDDVAHRREVAIQKELDDSFVVNSGLGMDDRIVVGGVRSVRDGEKVTPEGK